MDSHIKRDTQTGLTEYQQATLRRDAVKEREARSELSEKYKRLAVKILLGEM